LAKESRLKEEVPQGKVFRVKLSFDARANCSFANVVVVLIPLNLKSYATQDVESVFCLSAFKGQESRDYVDKYCSKIKDEIEDLQKNGFKENGVKYTFEPVWVSDLKALWCLCDFHNQEFCPWCDCKADLRFERRQWNKRAVPNMFFKIEKIQLCTLHAKQRIVEKLLKCTSFNNTFLVNKINKIISEEFKIARVKLKIEEENENDPYGFLKSNMISGADADKLSKLGVELVKKLQAIVGDEIDRGTVNGVALRNVNWNAVHNAWSLWTDILNAMETKTKDLEKLDFKNLQQTLDIWFEYLKLAFGNQGINYYVHILVDHLVDLLKDGTL